jgi:hypothetical protein
VSIEPFIQILLLSQPTRKMNNFMEQGQPTTSVGNYGTTLTGIAFEKPD